MAAERRRNDLLSSPFSFLCSLSLQHSLSPSFLSRVPPRPPPPYTHLLTQTHTHINSPLGVCCFHYLQLGPETAFRAVHSKAALARYSIYRKESGNCQLSVLCLSCASGGKYDCAASVDRRPALHPATTLCHPTQPPSHRAQVNRGNGELKATERPTATPTTHTAERMKQKERKSDGQHVQQRQLKIFHT